MATMVSALILSIYISYPFAVDPESLRAIGASAYASHMEWAVDDVLVICSVGTAAALLGYFLLPLLLRLRLHHKPSVNVPKQSKLNMDALTLGACVSSLIGIAFVWLFFVIVGVIPMLTKDPDFFRGEVVATHPSRYIYQGGFTMASIGFMFLLPGLLLKRIKMYRPFAWAVVIFVAYTNFLTATRSNFLVPIVFSGLIYFSIGPIKLTIPRALLLLLILLSAAAFLQALRGGGGDMTFSGIYNEFLHGNTLISNIRDSGWLLLNFQAHGYSFYWGKTILAQLMGFIPRGFMDFRTQYGWGPVTLDIIGSKNAVHLGFGHVYFFDWYLNFGYLGVVVEGLLLGLACHAIDASLLALRATAGRTKTYDFFKLFKVWFAWMILGCFLLESGIFYIYPYALGYAALYVTALIAQKITGRFSGVAPLEKYQPLARVYTRSIAARSRPML
jgi:oligosaccharide repeat unit polymerase